MRSLYRETYGEVETVETLVPFMLSAFLTKDRAFRTLQKRRANLMRLKDSLESL